jgi:spore germination protein KB
MFSQRKEQISYSQLVLLIMGFTLGSSTLLPPGRGANQDAWITVFLGFLEGSLFAIIYGSLSQRFSGKSLVEICDEVWGPYLGRIISFLFFLYVFHLGTLVVTNFADFTQHAILTETPPLVYTLMLVGLCTYAACQGIEVISRCSELLILVVTGFFLSTVVMLIPRLNTQNLLPILKTPLPVLLTTSHGAATFPFGEAVVFVMISPHLITKGKFRKSILIGLAGACLILIVGSVRSIGVLGPAEALFTYPAYSASKLIDLGDILTRVEIITAFDFLVLVFFKITLLILITMKTAHEIIGTKSYQTLATPFWILFSLIGVHNFSNNNENIMFANNVYPFLALPFQVFIPTLTLIVAMLRKRGRTK